MYWLGSAEKRTHWNFLACTCSPFAKKQYGTICGLIMRTYHLAHFAVPSFMFLSTSMFFPSVAIKLAEPGLKNMEDRIGAMVMLKICGDAAQLDTNR